MVKPYYQDEAVTIYHGDCRTLLSSMPDESVNCCVTSPPYFGLRDYGCDGQIGLEQTPDAYVAELVAVFREVRRVLRDDGTLWLNLGDSYAASSNTGGTNSIQGTPKRVGAMTKKRHGIPDGLKPKDLIGIPWRVAFALQADGWYLRQDIIWHKPNPMPESVTDRCTKAHEYIFLMTKAARYYYDAGAIAEKSLDEIGTHRGGSLVRAANNLGRDSTGMVASEHHGGGIDSILSKGVRNRRSVWTVATQPYKEAHFATFPPKLIEPCIMAGCPVGGVVLDPFSGSGTTAIVSKNLGRKAVGVELNSDYCEIAAKRMGQGVLALW